ncbi:MAG: ribosome silencing factor [Caulobacterales bacterium]
MPLSPDLSRESRTPEAAQAAQGSVVSTDASHEAEALVLKSLDDDKAEEIIQIDLKGKSSLADTMVIASGRSARHVAAIADHLVRTLKEAGFGRPRVEGMATADWVLIDAGDVIVHLFRPEVRTFYNLEKIWADGPGMRATA